MSNFEMFTDTGNSAVRGIVNNAAEHFETFEDAYTWTLQELDYLSRTSTYSEATDTAVRECVYDALKQEFPTLVFKSVRA